MISRTALVKAIPGTNGMTAPAIIKSAVEGKPVASPKLGYHPKDKGSSKGCHKGNSDKLLYIEGKGKTK